MSGVKLIDPATGLEYRAGGAQDGSGNTVITPVSGSSSATPSSSRTSVAADSLVLKASAGNLFGFEICTGAQAGYLMIFNANALPANGTVTPWRVYTVAANASFSRQLSIPLRFTAGITLAFSSTGPFTLTASATAFLAGDYV